MHCPPKAKTVRSTRTGCAICFFMSQNNIFYNSSVDKRYFCIILNLTKKRKQNMKKYYISLAFFIVLLLSTGCKHKEKYVTRQNVIVDHEKLHDFGEDDVGFGILYYRDLEDTILRVTFYDGYDYDYVELGDTLNLKMTKKMFRKEYNRCNMMYQEEVIIDPDSVLFKKNQMLKNDSLTKAKRELLRKQLLLNPIQIEASKAVRIRK